jgi:CRP-like cAMP-binding protein
MEAPNIRRSWDPQGRDLEAQTSEIPYQNDLLQPVEPVTRVFYLMIGAVELVVPHELHGSVSVAVLRAPAMLGTTDVLSNSSSAFGYRALGPCSGAWLKIADLASRPEILEEALRQGALERTLLARSASVMHDGAEARLAGLILRYAQAVGRRELGGVRILAKRSQQELGAACGLTLRHTTRVLGRWKRLGIVHKDAGHLVVNLEALSAGAALATPIFERRYSASAQA